MIDPMQNHMRAALDEAAIAKSTGDLAVGAVVVIDDEIVGRGHNKVTSTADPFAHAEVDALRDFVAKHPGRTLEDGFLVSTFEPCPMCLGALLVLRVGSVVIGGHRPEDDPAWGRYTPHDLAAITSEAKYGLRILSGPFADECLRTRGRGNPTQAAAASMKGNR